MPELVYPPFASEPVSAYIWGDIRDRNSQRFFDGGLGVGRILPATVRATTQSVRLINPVGTELIV